MKRSTVLVVMVGLLLSFNGQALADMNSTNAETNANIQRVNTLIGRAMGMVTEGASLVLVASTKLAPPTDPFTLQQGMQMIQNGKDLVQMALAGEGMSPMAKKEVEDDPMMKAAHGLADSILKYIEIVENMEMSGSIQRKIELHQLHLMINHALDMATEGANLVMLGNLMLTGQLDKYSIERGRTMLKDARAALNDASESETMKNMKQAAQGSLEEAMMTRTSELSQTALKIIDALEKLTM